MTLDSTDNRKDYDPDGVVVAFAYDFRVDDADDMVVYEDGVVVVGGYTVSGIGVDEGGDVTFDVAPLDSVDVLSLVREVPLTQETAYPALGPFPASSHEAALDKLTMIAQQQQTDIDTGILASTAAAAAAEASAAAAAISESNASDSADAAGVSESNASTSEGNASTSASLALASETAAGVSEGNASDSADAAALSAIAAAASEANAELYRDSTIGYATQASGFADDASDSAAAAAASESTVEAAAAAAAISAAASASSAGDALASETAAGVSEGNASTSEGNASTSASLASGSETAAGVSEGNASTSASNAANSETNAGISESNASDSAVSAEASSVSAAESAVECTNIAASLVDVLITDQAEFDAYFDGVGTKTGSVFLSGDTIGVYDLAVGVTYGSNFKLDGTNGIVIQRTSTSGRFISEGTVGSPISKVHFTDNVVFDGKAGTYTVSGSGGCNDVSWVNDGRFEMRVRNCKAQVNGGAYHATLDSNNGCIIKNVSGCEALSGDAVYGVYRSDISNVYEGIAGSGVHSCNKSVIYNIYNNAGSGVNNCDESTIYNIYDNVGSGVASCDESTIYNIHDNGAVGVSSCDKSVISNVHNNADVGCFDCDESTISNVQDNVGLTTRAGGCYECTNSVFLGVFRGNTSVSGAFNQINNCATGIAFVLGDGTTDVVISTVRASITL